MVISYSDYLTNNINPSRRPNVRLLSALADSENVTYLKNVSFDDLSEIMMRPIKEKLSCIVALTVVGNLWLFYFPWTGLAIMSGWKYTSCLSVCLSVVVILHPRTRCTASTTCPSTDCYGFCIPISKLFLINELLGWASCWQSGRRQHVFQFWPQAFRHHSKICKYKLTNQH